LTAPLVREVVNAILVEKDHTKGSSAMLSKAGKTVFGEYTLLNVFPRDISDAHVTGALHVNGLGTWILKPNEIMHDLRFFFQNGLKLASPFQISEGPPQNFEAALSIAFTVLSHTSREINELQTCDYFSIFIMNAHHHAEAALGLELSIPKFIADKAAVGPEGKTCGKYGDFAEESRLLASLVIEAFTEESSPKPLLNPKLIVKINSEALADEQARAVLLKAHSLAAEKGNPYFANTLQKEGKYTVFSTSGLKLKADLTGDWETDTLRTGCLGIVTVNLPRIVHESEKDKSKFFEILKERCELAARALRIKYRALRQRGKSSLPFMMQSSNGDKYFRLENCSRIINFAGFQESVETFCEKNLSHEESVKFAEEIVKNMLTFKHKAGRKHGKRLFPAVLRSLEASERLAQLDVEKYGIAKVKFSGTREKPFYSTTKRLNLEVGNFLYIPAETLEIEQKLEGLNAGGSLNIIELESNEYKPEELMNLTEHLIKNQDLEFFTYNRINTYCDNCRKSWFGVLHKCPSCGSMSTLTTFDRFAST